MISEQDKQKILNGEYGVSRNGLKCRFIGNTTNKFFIHMFVYFNNDDLIVDKATVNKDFVNDTYFESPTDIVGLWQDEPEPFDLEKALNGKPVLLRDGSKAYIKFVMPDEHKTLYPLNGYSFDPNEPDEYSFEQWTIEGKSFNQLDNDTNIIGMWKEKSELNTVTLTLPYPLKEPQDEMWFIDLNRVRKSGYIGNSITQKDFDQLIYFGSEADAKAWLDAMQNNRR